MTSLIHFLTDPIPEAADGLNDGCAKFSPEPCDEYFDGVRVTVETLCVDVLRQLSLGHDPPAVMHQVGKDAELMARQLHLHAVERHPRHPRIERHRPGPELRRYLATGATDQRAQPRQDFFHPERLGHVIVGATIDPLHLLVPASTGRQYQNRHRKARLAPRSDQRQSVDRRQTEIEDNGIVVLGADQEIGAFTVGGTIDGVTRLIERGRQLLRDQ